MKTDILSKSEVHLIFRLGLDFFGIPVSKTFNIIEISRMTSSIQDNELIIGNVNLRGTVIPIVNLNSKFGTKQDYYTYNTSILVLETNSKEKFHVGIIIDALHEVVEIHKNEIDSTINILQTKCNGCIKGYYKGNKQMNVGIIETDSIFTNDEITLLKKYIVS
jgi:purine-binding chemotaxis protein CheW